MLYEKNSFIKVSLLIATAMVAILADNLAWSQQKTEKDNTQKSYDIINKYRINEKNYARKIEITHFAIDKNENGIDKDDIYLFRKLVSARKRSQLLSSIAQYDLNNDRVIDTHEVEIVDFRRQPKKFPDADTLKKHSKKYIDSMITSFNLNKENLSIDDVFLLSEEYLIMRSREIEQLDLATFLLKNDPDKNGQVTDYESVSILTSRVQGKLKKNIKNTKSNIAIKSNLKCKLPPLKKKSELFLIKAGKGSNLSSVSVAGQSFETSTANIFIEDGTTPLYVVLASDNPIIWKFSGATERLKTLVVSGRARTNKNVNAGVMGLERSRVHFAANCGNAYSETGLASRVEIVNQLGTLPTATIDLPIVHELPLPSGLHRKATQTRNWRIMHRDGFINTEQEAKKYIKSEALRFFWRGINDYKDTPAGRSYAGYSIVNFDPELIISENKAEYYETLPRNAGLLQLLAEKKLEHLSENFYLIQDHIRLPLELAGARAATFVLPAGIPIPDGDQAHSCVFSQELNAFIGSPRRCERFEKAIKIYLK